VRYISPENKKKKCHRSLRDGRSSRAGDEGIEEKEKETEKQERRKISDHRRMEKVLAFGSTIPRPRNSSERTQVVSFGRGAWGGREGQKLPFENKM